MSKENEVFTDDLVERLYDRRVCSPAQNSCRNDWVLDQAADRIEQLAATNEELEAKLVRCGRYRDAYAECDRISTEAVRYLEVKLAKAVEALEELLSDCEADYPPSHGAIKHLARTTLAELKGGK